MSARCTAYQACEDRPGSPAEDGLYDAYLDAICADRIASIVKLADMRHNLGRLEHLDAATARRLRNRYEPPVERLLAVLAESD